MILLRIQVKGMVHRRTSLSTITHARTHTTICFESTLLKKLSQLLVSMGMIVTLENAGLFYSSLEGTQCFKLAKSSLTATLTHTVLKLLQIVNKAVNEKTLKYKGYIQL